MELNLYAECQNASAFSPRMAINFIDVWKYASQESKVRVTREVLRAWFCDEMGRLGVPISVLARRYSDVAPEKLQEICENAKLKVLS